MKRWFFLAGLPLLAAACTTKPAPEPAPAPPVVEEVLPIPEPPPPPPPKPDPADLLGLTPLEAQGLLGEPSLVRWEGPAQVRQFKKADCVFDLYFQEDAPGAAFRIIHMDARSPSGVPADPQSCLIALLPNGDWPDGVSPKEAAAQ